VSALVLASGVVIGCHPTGGPTIGASGQPENRTGSIGFKFDSIDERPVSSASTRGKPTVLAFVTTWDLSSQAQVDYLIPFAKKTTGVNFALVALQERKDRELVEAYRQSLHVDFPVALAGDPSIIAGGGPFGDVHEIPTVIILDRAGRMVWRHVGLAKPEEIRAGLEGL
jgi:hypothetical protein